MVAKKKPRPERWALGARSKLNDVARTVSRHINENTGLEAIVDPRKAIVTVDLLKRGEKKFADLDINVGLRMIRNNGIIYLRVNDIEFYEDKKLKLKYQRDAGVNILEFTEINKSYNDVLDILSSLSTKGYNGENGNKEFCYSTVLD